LSLLSQFVPDFRWSQLNRKRSDYNEAKKLKNGSERLKAKDLEVYANRPDQLAKDSAPVYPAKGNTTHQKKVRKARRESLESAERNEVGVTELVHSLVKTEMNKDVRGKYYKEVLAKPDVKVMIKRNNDKNLLENNHLVGLSSHVRSSTKSGRGKYGTLNAALNPNNNLLGVELGK